MLRALVLGALLVLGPSLARAAEPWRFSGDEKKAAEKKYPGYWNENYLKATELLDRPGGDLDEAIVRLKLAIAAGKVQNDPAAITATRDTIEYFPYYFLAVAYSRKGNCAAAHQCLERGSEQIRNWRRAQDFVALQGRMEACAAAGDLIALADKILGWEGGKDGIGLGPEARGKLAQIRGLKERLGSEGTDPKAPADQLRGLLTDVCGAEVRTRSALLTRLNEDWKQAFPPSALSEIAPASCQAPPQDGSAKGVADLCRALERCDQTAVKASRRAGAWGCESLAALRKETRRSFDDLRAWTEAEGGSVPAAEALPAPPASCIEWTKAPAAKVVEAFAALAGERTQSIQAFEARKREADGRLAARRADLRKKLEGALAELPGLTNECVVDLQLGQSVPKQLRSLRDSLSPSRVPDTGVPSKDLFQPDRLVQAALDDLGVRLKGGVEQLRLNGDCEGIARANLEKLPGALTGYLGGRAASELDNLCRTARNAEIDIQGCWEKNSESVRTAVGQYVDLLQAAEQGSRGAGAVLGAQDGGPGCLNTSLSALTTARAKPMSATAAAWVKQARSALGTAQACLKDFHKSAGENHALLLVRVRNARQMLEGISGLPRVEATREELRAIESRLEKVAPLYEAGADLGGRARQVLDGAGMGGELPAEVRKLLGTGQNPEHAPGEAGWPVVRDAIVLPELGRAQDLLSKWEAPLERLVPFAALNSAFLAYARGDLDDAILTLRKAGRSDRAPLRGREAAMAHAAMSYFLHTKGRALSSGRGDADLAESLEQEARQEARLAIRADGGFRLPDGLFQSAPFRQAFQSYTQEDTR
jgi:hypothetical protein